MSAHLASVRIGNTTVRITGEGCHECGTTFSVAWFIGRQLDIVVGNRTLKLDLMICHPCKQRQRAAGRYQQNGNGAHE